VEHLQHDKDDECLLFQKVAEQGHYAGVTKPSTTRQGTYAITANGTFLTSWNNNNPRFVAGKLREALKNWERFKAEGRTLSDGARLDPSRLDRADRFYPEGGLILRVNTRDLPREKPQTGRWADAWNQDFAWFTKDEARQFVPEGAEPGQTREIPRALVARLARLHLLDNVRGQTSSFPAAAVEDAQLTSKVTDLDGDVVSLRLEGRTRTVQKGTWSIRGYRDMNSPSAQERGVETKLLGFARYDRRLGRFVSFEMVAAGSRWGGTQYNGRGNDLAPAPFGAVLSLASDARADRVAPEHFRGYGWR
jgi:hypothetical protein